MARAVRRIVRSFGFAFEGLVVVARTQPNFAVHLTAAGLVIVAAVALRLSGPELALVFLTICVVLAAEAFNTAVEALADRVSAEFDPLVKRAKDTAAAGVLLAAAGAVAVGVAIFGPRIWAVVTGQAGFGV